MLIELRMASPRSGYPIRLSDQQRNEVLAAFPSSVEVRWSQEEYRDRRTGDHKAGLAVDTIVIASLAIAGGQISAGFFGEIGKDVWKGIKKGLARLLGRLNDAQYHTIGTAYVLLDRPDGKTIALECPHAVFFFEEGTLSDEQIEERLGHSLDFYQENEPKLTKMLERITARSGRPVLLITKTKDQLRVRALNSLEGIDVPDPQRLSDFLNSNDSDSEQAFHNISIKGEDIE